MGKPKHQAQTRRHRGDLRLAWPPPVRRYSVSEYPQFSRSSLTDHSTTVPTLTLEAMQAMYERVVSGEADGWQPLT